MLDPSHHAERIRRLLLAVPNRRRVFEAISHVPGTHLRRLSRELRLAIGSVEHHLRQLERHGLVFSYRAGRRKSYFETGALEPQDAAILHALRKPSWGRSLERLLERGEAEPSQIARDTGISPDAASYALRRMCAAGLVDRVHVGRYSVYALSDPDRVRRLQSLVQRPSSVPGPPLDHPIFGTLIRRAQDHRPPPSRIRPASPPLASAKTSPRRADD